MEEPDSPVLSCKKGIKRHSDLTASPVLSSKKPARCLEDLTVSPVLSSNERKRKRRPSESPVFLRSSYSRKRHHEAEKSPEINHFTSPARCASPIKLHQQNLKPKSLFPEIEAPSSQDSGSCSSSQETACQVIEDSQSDNEESDDNLNILEKTWSEEEANISITTRNSASSSSLSITQCSSFLSICCTPPKKSQKKVGASCSGSSRKKNQKVPNGMAKQLTRLIARQETDFRLWKFQLKLHPIDVENEKTLTIRLVAIHPGEVHHFVECKLISGDLSTDDVCLLFTTERWQRFNLHEGDVVSISEPWQSVHLAERRATLVLAFNLIRKRGALPNSPLRRRYIEDTALRRPAPDNVPVAENRRPSTVLQEWTCPSQGCSCHFRSAAP